MREFVLLLAYLLSAIGLTILVVWPENGPGAFFREKILRKLLPVPLHGALDCYICFGFWAGLILSVAFWLIYGRAWMCFGCLMIAAALHAGRLIPTIPTGRDFADRRKLRVEYPAARSRSTGNSALRFMTAQQNNLFLTWPVMWYNSRIAMDRSSRTHGILWAGR